MKGINFKNINFIMDFVKNKKSIVKTKRPKERKGN